MAFVAHARPEQIGHAYLFAEQGNRVRIPDTERSQPIGFAGSESGQRAIRAGPGGRLPKVAVFLKHCFPCKVNLACGENRSLEGLSWPGEKAEAMRWQ